MATASTLAHEAEETARHRELAAFLRSMRARLDPAAAGVTGRRRRVPGWLREEVAAAAGISATWYMQLEQARPVRASPRALDGLARALRLDPAGRSYLYRLARPDLEAAGAPPPGPSAGLAAFVAGLSPHPAYALDPRWDLVTWNPEADFLLGGLASGPRNLVARLFTDPATRARFADWESLAPSVVGQFRAAAAGLAGDPRHGELVADLERRSPEFRRLWHARGLAETPSWLKAFRHPEAGPLAFRYTTLRPLGPDAGFTVTIYTPATARDAACFAAAR